MMIIDTHTHIGNILVWNLKQQTLVDSMKKYNIDFSLVSNVESSEVDQKQRDIPKFLQKSQYNSNKTAIDFVKKHKNILGAMIWCKPKNEHPDEKFINLIEENFDYIYGFKFHPFASGVPFDDKRVYPFLDVAQKFNLPVLVHTATDECSKPIHVYNVAKKYPKINFIMGHMELATDNFTAMKYIMELPNLYGDTCWVNPERVVDFIKNGGEDKIMFGTDNTIDGADTLNHEWYQKYMHGLSEKISEVQYEKLMFKNAQKLFKISF